MISEETRTRVRALFYGEHWKIGTISASLGLHPDTVALAVETERMVNAHTRLCRSRLDPFKSFIDETLSTYPKLRATRLLEMLRLRGYEGGCGILRRYVRRVRKAPRHEAFLRLTTLPGEQGQVDWGCFGSLMVGHAKRPLSCFVMTLSHSRGIYARFFLDQRMESFLEDHVRAFTAFGGAPRKILYDNLKSVVLERVGVDGHRESLELGPLGRPATWGCDQRLRFLRWRQESPSMSRMTQSSVKRSTIGVTLPASPNIVPHCLNARLVEITVLRTPWRACRIWYSRSAARGSAGR